MYKAVVFFDLDKTLLNDEKQVPPENVAALKVLEANHVLPVIATGRNYYELDDIMAVTGVRSAIAANGGDIFLEGEHIFQSVIGEPQLTRFLNASAARNIQVAMYTSDQSALTRDTMSWPLIITLRCGKPRRRLSPIFTNMKPSACY